MVKDIVLSMIKRGDIVEIVPIDKLPNLDRVLKVWDVSSNGIIYNVSVTCDGYEMPFSWIKEVKIVGRWHFRKTRAKSCKA